MPQRMVVLVVCVVRGLLSLRRFPGLRLRWLGPVSAVAALAGVVLVAGAGPVAAGSGCGPVNTGPPVLSPAGSGGVGTALATTGGDWQAGCYPLSGAVTYQWYRGSSAISGATSSSYTTVAADANHLITAQVTQCDTQANCTAATTFGVFEMVAPLGTPSYTPVWSHGPVAVNEATGNLVLSLPTPSYPTATGSLGFSLTYNSQATAAGSDGLATGWVLSTGDASAPSQVMDDGTDGSLTATAEVDWPDGSPEFYQEAGSGNTYLPLQLDGSQLTKTTVGTSTTWTLVEGDGSTYTFNAENPTTGVATLNSSEIPAKDETGGDGQLSYSYDLSGRVTSVAYKETPTSSSSETLTFTWGCTIGTTSYRFCVTGPDGVQWGYSADATSNEITGVYDGTRNLVALTYTGGQLTKIQNADDLDPSHSSSGYNGSHALTLTYDSASPARVTCVIDGPISGQAATSQPSCAGGGTASESTWSLNYSPTCPSLQAPAHSHSVAQGTSVGCTTLTNPDQQPSGPGITVLYDSNYRTLEVDDARLGTGNDRISLVQYNAQNQIAWSEDAAGNPTDYSYDADTHVLRTVTGPAPASGQARPVTSYRQDEQTIGSASSWGNPLTGLAGTYWTSSTPLTGLPVAKETDPAPGSGTTGFSFSNGSNWPPTAVSGNTSGFSARWTGELTVSEAGDYVFTTTSHDSVNNVNDGTHLVVNGVDALDNMSGPSSPVSSQTLHLRTGVEYQVTLEYAHLSAGTSGASLALQWACSDCSPAISQANIPVSDLAPAWENQTSVVSPAGRISFQHYLNQASGQPDYSLVKGGGADMITSYVYDSLGRLTKQFMPKANASATIDSTTGNLISTPDTNYETDYTYYGDGTTAAPPAACGGGTAVDQYGQLEQTSIPNGGLHSVVTVYNTAGQPVAITNGKGTSCLTYDSGGEQRLLSQTSFGSTSFVNSYTYDPNGTTLTSTNQNGTVTDSYDEANRLIDTVDVFGAEASYSYDADGNKLQQKAANASLSGSTNYTTNYGYDAADEQTSETDPAGNAYSFFYDNRGNLRGTQYPNGTFSWVDTDPEGDISDQYNRHGTISSATTTPPADSNPLADYSYTYVDSNGVYQDGKRLSEVRKSGASSQTTTYTYDHAGRLHQVLFPNNTCRFYSYDLDSNRTSIQESTTGCSGPATTTTYTYDPTTTPGTDELTKIVAGSTTTTYTYRNDGQVTSQGSTSYTWNNWGQLATATVGTNTITYNYDATGFENKRVSSSPATTTNYKLADTFETDGSGAITTSYTDGPAGDLASYAGPPKTTSTVSYLYYDAHGNLAAEANSSGSQTANHTYDPFGAPTDTIPTNSSIHRFVGRWNKQYDTTDNLILMGARPYDPNTGRFLSVDPIPGGSLNNYDYAGQDPINNYDLSGSYFTAEGTGEGGGGGDFGPVELPGEPEAGDDWSPIGPVKSPRMVYNEVKNLKLSFSEWGKEIWGARAEGALAKIGTRDAAQLERLGLNVKRATELRNFYYRATTWGEGGAAANARIRLMNSIIRTLKAAR